tara:strand:- start:32 stop:400 length:369 start_codon:yes stop_codon:yes gene_type:complete
MAHFAKIGMNGKVIEVFKVNNQVILDADGNESEINGIDFLTKLTGWSIWKQTSYNSNFRKNYAGLGMTYDEDRDAFIPKKPFNSWTLNETTCLWEAPVARPDDNQSYSWNEESQQWEVIDNS